MVLPKGTAWLHYALFSSTRAYARPDYGFGVMSFAKDVRFSSTKGDSVPLILMVGFTYG